MFKYQRLVLLVLVTVGSCSHNDAFVYHPKPGVEVRVVVFNTESHETNNQKWIALNFDFEIRNDNREPLFFKVDSIEVNYNNVDSRKVYHRSFASVLAMRDSIIGSKRYELYAVLPATTESKSLKRFEVTNFGFVK